MNGIRKINEINQKELESGVSDLGSWHYDYKDTCYLFLGGLHPDLKESDIITIFSQYGIPTHINLIRDKETQQSKGFCYLKYQSFKSCILAIDNFNGISLYNKNIKVDHVYYKLRENQKESDFEIDYSSAKQPEPRLIELLEPASTIDEFTDPMEQFIKKKPEKETSKRSERSERSESSERSERSEKSEKSERSEKSKRRERDDEDKDDKGHSSRTKKFSSSRRRDKSRIGETRDRADKTKSDRDRADIITKSDRDRSPVRTLES